MLTLVPVSLRQARRFVAEHHRHNGPPVGWKFGVGVEAGRQLVGVAIAGRPVAPGLDTGIDLEVLRTCTIGVHNANSMLYGAIARAAKALGHRHLYTYTLADEPGSSLRAVGFEVDAQLEARGGWASRSRPRYERDLFGDRTPVEQDKVRWVRHLRAGCCEDRR